MLFNSFEYLIFLPTVFLLYWIIGGRKRQSQNLFLLIASYFFYGWWDYRFLVIIFFSTLIDYWSALKIKDCYDSRMRKFYLRLSISINLGVLCLFKYFNFFLESITTLTMGKGYSFTSLSIILPVGISFYTFQTMAYTIDVYRGKVTPTRNFISFATFVAFFPQLVAGPIERARQLLPQIVQNRKVDKGQWISGLKLILWGLFKKVAVADSLAPVVEQVFNDYQSIESGALWVGMFFFFIQIYCDFSGYSDIAIGSAKLFGFELMSNFKYPYFSRNFSEFWQRWHISLNNWFKTYVYTALVRPGKTSTFQSIKNTFILFTLSGLWHGANWTFVAWGALSWLLFLPHFLKGKLAKQKKPKMESVAVAGLKDLPSILLTVLLLAWISIPFRSKTIGDAYKYNVKMFSAMPDFSLVTYSALFYITLLFVIEWINRENEREPLSFKNRFVEYWVLIFVSILTFLNFGKNPQEFIYFAF